MQKSDGSIIKAEVGNTWLRDMCLVFPFPGDVLWSFGGQVGFCESCGQTQLAFSLK